jgi:hypothetical protein
MRVTIGHREEAAGLAGQNRNYFVDCTVELSEEEKAVVKARGLQGDGFTTRAATPIPDTVSIIGVGILRGGGWLLLIAGVIFASVGDVTKNVSTGNLGGLLILVGIVAAIYGWLRGRRVDKRLELPDQEVTLRRLLADPRFTVHALDPVHAKALDDEIRAHLIGLKDLIRGSAELQVKQTFEL